MHLNLNSTEGQLLVILLVGIGLYCLYKLGMKWTSPKEEKPLKTVDQKGSRPVWTKDTKKRWTTSGWYFDEAKGEWVPPDYIDSKKNTSMPKYRGLDPAERDKLIRLSKDGPTFEEWKAARMKDEQEKLK